MKRKLLALIARFRLAEDAVFCARLSALDHGQSRRDRIRGQVVSPFRFVAVRPL